MGRKSIAKERRQLIIEAFYSCVVEFGLSGASIRKIADRAGVKPSVLHHYFSSRDEIIEEAVVYFTDMIFMTFQKKMDKIPKSADPIAEGFEFIFSKGMIKEEYTGFFLECCVAARSNERIKETIAQLFERFRGAIVDSLKTLDGFERLSTVDQKMLATMIVAIHEGIELQWFARKEAVNLAHAIETSRHLIRFFMKEKAKKTAGISLKN